MKRTTTKTWSRVIGQQTNATADGVGVTASANSPPVALRVQLMTRGAYSVIINHDDMHALKTLVAPKPNPATGGGALAESGMNLANVTRVIPSLHEGQYPFNLFL